VEILDLARHPDITSALDLLPAETDGLCLFVGSPVYATQPVPPVMTFLRGLPSAAGAYAVPFVTYGGVTSGIALALMGRELEAKGYTLLGAAKVLAPHSMMWDAADPLGEGHPDEDDDRMIEELVDVLGGKLDLADPAALSVADLDYQSPELREMMAGWGVQGAKDLMPKKHLDRDRCTQCGICVDNCPVGAIRLDPYPVIEPSCIHCLNCIRLCPEEAITADLSANFARIRKQKERIQEPFETRIFT
jgi:ferredoxin